MCRADAFPCPVSLPIGMLLVLVRGERPAPLTCWTSVGLDTMPTGRTSSASPSPPATLHICVEQQNQLSEIHEEIVSFGCTLCLQMTFALRILLRGKHELLLRFSPQNITKFLLVCIKRNLMMNTVGSKSSVQILHQYESCSFD